MDLILYLILLVLATSELIQWLDLSRAPDSYKLELSILWGLYAVMLIVLGIWKKKKHLRIMAIALFSGTLLKVFLYDISHLNTISKTIVLIILGTYAYSWLLSGIWFKPLMGMFKKAPAN